jgi:hypothetical protein
LVSFGSFTEIAAGQTCCVTDTACSKGSVPQIRVVVLVVMVGIRLGDSGGDGTLKSLLKTTPSGQKFGSAAGHRLPLLAVVSSPAFVVGSLPAVAAWSPDGGTVPADEGVVVIPAANDVAHKRATPMTRGGRG